MFKKIIASLAKQIYSIPLVVSVMVVLGPLTSTSLGLTNSGYHDDQRVLEVLCLSLGALLLILNLWCDKPVWVSTGKPIAGLMAIFFIFGFFSSVVAYSPRYALYEWSSFGLLLLLAGVIANEVARNLKQQLDLVLLVLGLGCALYVFNVALVYVWVLQSGMQPDVSEFIVGFNNYRFFNHVQTISFPLLGLLTLRSGQQSAAAKNPAHYWWVLLSLWWMLLLVSSGRGTFVGILTGIIMVFFWRGRQALPWCRIMLFSAMAGLAAYGVFFLLLPMLMGLQPFWFLNEIVERSIANPGSSRGALWQRAIEMTMSHPLLGAGPLHFAHYGRDINNGAHPHSWPLQIATEWGIPALLSLSAVVFIAFRKLLDSARMIALNDLQNQAVLTTWLATGIAILTDGLVSGLIVMPSSQLWIVIYIGCAWGWTSSFAQDGSAEKSMVSIKIKIGLSFLILIMILFLGKGLWPEIIDLQGRQDRESELNPGMRLAPRIWGSGYF